MSGDTAPEARSWCLRRDEKKRRMESIRPWMDGPVLQADASSMPCICSFSLATASYWHDVEVSNPESGRVAP